MPNTDLEKALAALKEADRQGNVEDAQKLAQLADKLRKTETIKPEQKNLGMGPFINRGLSSIGVTEGASSQIRQGLRAVGIAAAEREPENFMEAAGQGIGEAASWLLPMGAASKLLARGSGLAATVARDIMSTMSKYPKTSMLSEVTGGAGAGMGRKAEKEGMPFGEIAGGVAGSLSPEALAFSPAKIAARTGKNILSKATLPFTEAGATYRASEFLKKQVVSPEETANVLGLASIGNTPPPIQTGEKRIVALYNKLRTLDPATDAVTTEGITKSMFQLEQEMRALGYDSPEILKDVIGRRVKALESNIDGKIVEALGKAQSKLDVLPTTKSKGSESSIVRSELDMVAKEDYKIVEDIWKQVREIKDIKINYTGAQRRYKEIVEDLAEAQKVDIPVVLKKSFVAKKQPDFEPGKNLPEKIEIKEIQGLRSKLLEEARIARKNGKWNKARISEQMADALLDDMGANAKNIKTPEGELLNMALDATRMWKDRFEKGIVGKIRGYDKSGVPAIDPTLTLDVSIGRMAEKGAVDLSKVVVTPEARKATERYLGRSFSDFALNRKTMKLDPIKARKWIDANQAILKEYPELASQITDASKAQSLAQNTIKIMEQRKKNLLNPKIGYASKFLNTDLGKEIPSIYKSKNPVAMTKQLYKQAQRDMSGQSIDGLRGGFVQDILNKSSLGTFDEYGQKALSGVAMLDYIGKNREVLGHVFSSEQIGRLNKIAKELSNFDLLKSSKGLNIDYETDYVTKFLHFAAKIGGAAWGRHVSHMLGGGTVQIPGYFSSWYGSIAKALTKNRFEQIISDAMLDPSGDLLKVLFTDINKPTSGNTKNLDFIKTKLNAYLVGTGSRVLQDIQENED
uniref:Uncharacterized protein n=3 Tax=viral metagenome TaxID=1070528 RepID=A0A6M3J8H8_9ZZZZ